MKMRMIKRIRKGETIRVFASSEILDRMGIPEPKKRRPAKKSKIQREYEAEKKPQTNPGIYLNM